MSSNAHREHSLRTVVSDVLVVGGGAAGSRAAVAAAEVGARTVLVLKGDLGRSGSTCFPAHGPHGSAYQAADGCSAADGDSPGEHYRDIMEAGLGMADPHLARLLADEASERLGDLISWGFVPDPEPDPSRGRPHWAGYSCFATKPRAHGIWDVSAGHAGALVTVAIPQIHRLGVTIVPHVMLSDLLVQDGMCVGALGIDGNGELVIFRAAAVILATGGVGQLFPRAMASPEVTGDGYAMALRAGAQLANLEFMQFMIHSLDGGPVLWMLCPEVRNLQGEPVLGRYLPSEITLEEACEARTLHYPFSTRDASRWIDNAICSEAQRSRGEGQDGTITLAYDSVRCTARARAGLRARPQHHYPGPRVGPVPLPDRPTKVAHAAHAINGGLCISSRAESTLPGLFAVGETAAGPHGADRLGGNMLPTTQVFGRRAGVAAADRARGGPSPLSAETLTAPRERIARFASREGNRRSSDLKRQLQEQVSQNLSVVRNAAGLTALLDEVAHLRAEELNCTGGADRPELCKALELDNLLLVAEAMGGAALMRAESRGSHFRADFPALDDDRWTTNITCRLVNGHPALRKESLCDTTGRG